MPDSQPTKLRAASGEWAHSHRANRRNPARTIGRNHSGDWAQRVPESDVRSAACDDANVLTRVVDITFLTATPVDNWLATEGGTVQQGIQGRGPTSSKALSALGSDTEAEGAEGRGEALRSNNDRWFDLFLEINRQVKGGAVPRYQFLRVSRSTDDPFSSRSHSPRLSNSYV